MRRQISGLFIAIFLCTVSCAERAFEARVSSEAASQRGQQPEEHFKFGFDLRTIRSGIAADDVIAETLNSKGNVTSKYRLKASDSLDAGMRWIGSEFSEIGTGVFRSSDTMRQFRIDQNSLTGKHAPGLPHVHFETYEPGANKPTTNNHVLVDEK